MIGTAVSHYKILAKLGEGGMGVVYKAEDTRLKRTVALKFLPPALTIDAEAKERFIQEAQAASSLQHENICTIHDIDETDDGRLFIVMDCYAGTTLKDRLAGGALPVEEGISIARQIAEGLAEAHAKGIVHRDIKPANIMITDKGQVKIMDFGLAKLAGQAHLTQTGATTGTIAYMSPEQARGENVDQRTDIWSLGVVLYEMVMGQRPFKGEYDQAVVYGILNEEPPPLTTMRTGMPLELERITIKMLAKKPTERYQNANELLLNLQKLKTTTPVTPKRKSPTAVYTVLGVILLALICVSAWIYLQKRADLVQRRKSIAVLPFHPITKSEDDQSFAEGIHDDILTQVSKISDLKVIARTSVLRYRDTQKSIKEIARELGVGTVLEGTTRRSGNMIRVTAQLIDADTEEHLWADTYDRPYADIFAIQSDVAQKIATALQAQLAQEELRSIQMLPTKNMAAYTYFKKGEYFWYSSFDWEGNLKAAEMFEEACQLDTTFALAYTWQSICYGLVYSQTRTRNTKNYYYLKSETALTRAVSLAPDIPEVHLARGYYFTCVKRDDAAALKEAEIANIKRPNNTDIFTLMANLLMRKGDFHNALAVSEKLYQLDPKAGTGGPEFAAKSAFGVGRYDDAIRWSDIVIANVPDAGAGYSFKINFTLWGFGDIDRAEGILKEAKNLVTREKDTLLLPEFFVYYYKRDYARALATLLESKVEKYFLWRGKVLKCMNQPEEVNVNLDSARMAFSSILDTTPSNGAARLSLATAYAGLGDKTRALQEMAQVDNIARGGQGLDIAYFYILLNDNDGALSHLEKCIADPLEATASQLRLDPFLDPLRGNPRFDKVIEMAANRYIKK